MSHSALPTNRTYPPPGAPACWVVYLIDARRIGGAVRYLPDRCWGRATTGHLRYAKRFRTEDEAWAAGCEFAARHRRWAVRVLPIQDAEAEDRRRWDARRRERARARKGRGEVALA